MVHRGKMIRRGRWSAAARWSAARFVRPYSSRLDGTSSVAVGAGVGAAPVDEAVAFGLGAGRAARGFGAAAAAGVAEAFAGAAATGAAAPTFGSADGLTVVTAGVVGTGAGAATGGGAAAAVTAGGGAATWTDSFAPRRDQRLRPKASAAAAQHTVAKVFHGLRSARATSWAPSAGGGP